MRPIINGGLIPDVQFGRMASGEIESVSAREFFAHGRAVVLGIPGAFTPVCTKQHVPDFVRNAEKLRASGIAHLVCIAPNDPFVLAEFDLPPLNWSSLKYGFDQGGLDRWQGRGTRQKR